MVFDRAKQARNCRVWQVFLLVAYLLIPRAAMGQSTSALSARHINEVGAALFAASHALIEGPSLRLPNESLPDYIKRLVRLLPGETAAQRAVRLAGYLAALQKATDATAEFRRLPVLCDVSAENHNVWNTAVKACSLMPLRMKRLRAAAQSQKPGWDTELTSTLYTLLAARDALRDAKP